MSADALACRAETAALRLKLERQDAEIEALTVKVNALQAEYDAVRRQLGLCQERLARAES